MNKLGVYNNDERGYYSFNFSDNDGKNITLSFRAEPDYDLDIVFNEFRNFLIASGHDIEGGIGELFLEDEYEEDEFDAKNPTQDKFSMEHLPKNGWPFGGLTSESVPALTTADISAISSQYDWSKVKQYPTMAPLTKQQIEESTFKVPGTIGGAKVDFK